MNVEVPTKSRGYSQVWQNVRCVEVIVRMEKNGGLGRD
jgi:hypothetical protein